MEYVRQKYLSMLEERKWNGLVKIVTGARRVGKSYLMNELFYRSLRRDGVPANHIIRFSFDSDEDIDLLNPYYPEQKTKIRVRKNVYLVNAAKFRAYIKDHTNDTDEFYLLLDEVQLLENFTGTLNSYLRHKNFDLYVTGSNSHFLSSDIATEFRGRGSEIHVLPLTFHEYCENMPADQIPGAWGSYLIYGGIPIVAQMQTETEKTSYLKNLCNETYLKDIVDRNGIKKTQELSDTFDMFASMIGSPVNISKLANTFRSLHHKEINEDTMNRFEGFMEDAYLISRAKKYSIKGKRYIDQPFKLYFEDTGVRNARLNFRQIEETHLMENIIYNELRARGFNVDVGEMDVNVPTDRTDVNGKKIYARRSLEVDFVATLGSRKYYVQSALSLADQDKEYQEKRSLYAIDDSFKKIVVTKNGMPVTRDEKGIVTMDLFTFLLHENSLDL